MAYSLKTKNEIINQIRQGMSIKAASRTYNIARMTIRRWLKSPPKSLSTARTGRTPYDIEVKVEVIRLFEEENLSVRQIADSKRIRPGTIYHWIKDKTYILAVYSSQGQPCINNDKANNLTEEKESMSKTDDKDSKQHDRAIEAENEFLKARVAYLEALMELNGIPESSIKKKHNTRPSTKSSEKESET